jgi:hypothetical protein
MNRRGFLQSILIAAAAPAIVRADRLMRIIPQETTLFVPNSEPVLLVADRIFSATDFLGGWPGMDVALLMRQRLEEAARRRGKVHDLNIMFDKFARSDGTHRLQAVATFNREVPIYHD